MLAAVQGPPASPMAGPGMETHRATGRAGARPSRIALPICQTRPGGPASVTARSRNGDPSRDRACGSPPLHNPQPQVLEQGLVEEPFSLPPWRALRSLREMHLLPPCSSVSIRGSQDQSKGGLLRLLDPAVCILANAATGTALRAGRERRCSPQSKGLRLPFFPPTPCIRPPDQKF